MTYMWKYLYICKIKGKSVIKISSLTIIGNNRQSLFTLLFVYCGVLFIRPRPESRPSFCPQFSYCGRRKGGFSRISSSFWSRRIPPFWTSQSYFLWSKWFFGCELLFIDKPIVITEPRCTKRQTIRAWVRNCILTKCKACSTKLLFDSCGV